MSDQITVEVYGADWCGDCKRAKSALNQYGVAFTWHDIETEAGAADKAIDTALSK